MARAKKEFVRCPKCVGKKTTPSGRIGSMMRYDDDNREYSCNNCGHHCRSVKSPGRKLK